MSAAENILQFPQPADTITVLRAPGAAQTKTIKLVDGQLKAVADGAKTTRWRGQERPVSDIATLADVLELVARDPYSIVLRAGIKAGVDKQNMLRRLYDRPEVNETATLETVPHFWSIHDIDKLECDFDPYQDIERTVRHVIGLMPPAFQNATCWYAFSSSAGLEPAGVFRINMRLGFWHDRALTDAELARWMKPYPACCQSVYRPAQPIYVNKPKLDRGVQDPLEGRCARSGLVRGTTDVVLVPDIPAEVASTAWRADAVELPADAKLEDIVALIGDAPGELGCNMALQKVIGLYWQRWPRGSADGLEAAIRRRFAEATWDEKLHPPAERNRQLANLKGFIKRIYDNEWRSLVSGLEDVTAEVGTKKIPEPESFISPRTETNFDEAEPSYTIRPLPTIASIASRGLALNDKGRAADTYENAMRAVAASGLQPAYNELKMTVEFLAPELPWGEQHGRVLNDALLLIVRMWLTNIHLDVGYSPSPQHAHDALRAVAYSARFNPICDYLDRLQWDGVPRVADLFGSYFNCGDDPYVQGVSTCFMVGAVRRQRSPGCKFDNMPILQSPQGWYKSSAIETLFGNDWFSDASLGNLRDKDAAMLLRGRWAQEFAELESMGRADTAVLKAFCSRQIDRQRDPFGRIAEDVPRRVVFIGTTNEGGFLKDSTGNRRYWPLKVLAPIDVAKIKADRDQLWAEAACLEAQHVSDVLPRELWAVAAERAADETSEDPWADVLRANLDGGGPGGGFDMNGKPAPPKDKVHSSELFSILGISAEHATKDKAQRLRVVMEHALGWQHSRGVRVGDRSAAGYTRGELTPKRC